MGNKAKGGSTQTAAGHCIEAVCLKVDLLPFCMGLLTEDPVIVGSTGGLQVKGNLVPHLVKPVQQPFIVLCGDFLVNHFLCPAGGDQQKQMVGRGLQLYTHIQNLFDIVDIVLGHGGIDLELDTGCLEELNPLHRASKSTLHHPKPVVLMFISAINGNAYALDARRFYLFNKIRCQERSVRGHHHTKAEPRTPLRQFKYVSP